MRRALERLAAALLTLLITSVVALTALTALARERSGTRTAEPLFFNPAPRNVRDLAWAAVERIAAGRGAAEARAELARLGGAALPHVLPNLDRLAPRARGDVALALAPLARRMGVATENDLTSRETALTFWVRFWQDRSSDFRPELVARAVARLAQQSYAQRREEVLSLDTYALPELLRVLGPVHDEDDVLRAARLTPLLAYVTGRGHSVERNMTVFQAATVVSDWHDFWAAHGRDFVTLDGPRRLTAMFAETGYGRWVEGLLALVLGRSSGRANPLGIGALAALTSAFDYAAALAATLFLGAVWAAFELERAGSSFRSRLSRVLAALLVSLPAPLAAAWLGAPDSAWSKNLLLSTIAGLSGAAVVSRSAVAMLRDLDPPRLTRSTVFSAALRALPAALPWLLTSLFALELGLGIAGAGRAILASLEHGEIAAGMSLALAGALVAALATSVAGVEAPEEEQRLSTPSLIEVDVPRRRRRSAIALGTCLALAALGASAFGLQASSPALRELSLGASALLGYGTLTLATAAFGGIALGSLAASGPRFCDAALGRATELAAALPAALWAAALAVALGNAWVLALALGALRAIDVGWVLRSELAARALEGNDIGARTLGRFPLRAYFRGRLLPAILPALSASALTPAWCVALATAGLVAGVRVTPGQLGWGALLSDPSRSHFLALIALLLTTLTSWVLLSSVVSRPRRIGLSLPPPAPAPEPEEPSTT